MRPGRMQARPGAGPAAGKASVTGACNHPGSQFVIAIAAAGGGRDGAARLDWTILLERRR